VTERAEYLAPAMYAIDHLAVSAELVTGEPVAAIHRARWDERQLSNHTAYTADVRL
jgi:hypothetical protein